MNASVLNRTPGRVYILRSSSHASGLVKVGMTQRSVAERAKELSSATGVPSPFIVMFEEEVGGAGLAERLVHEKLRKFRVNERREFLMCQ